MKYVHLGPINIKTYDFFSITQQWFYRLGIESQRMNGTR